MAGMRGGLPIRAQDVVVGAGAKLHLHDPSTTTAPATVIYPPGFPIYESQIVACGAKPVPVQLKEGRDFAFDPAELEKLITPKTKLLILNTPHNPTGGILSRKDLQAIAAILQKHPHIWVYADEIYSRLCYTEAFFSIAQLPGMYERTIISDGASKTWAMTGWRIGLPPTCRAGADALDHQHRLLRIADRSGRQWRRSTARRTPRAMKSFPERRDLIRNLNGAGWRRAGVLPQAERAGHRSRRQDSEEFRKRLLNGRAWRCSRHPLRHARAGRGQRALLLRRSGRPEQGVAQWPTSSRRNTEGGLRWASGSRQCHRRGSHRA
jgi:aspartate/methionine/tyrosine aminotransferase